MAAIETIRACAGGDETDNRDYSVFTPEIIHQPRNTAFFLSRHSYYGYEGYSIPETIPSLTDRNTDEWFDYFEKKIAKKDIEWLVYESETQQVELIKRKFTGEKVNTDTLNKPFLSQLAAVKGIREILDYIILAKKSAAYFNPDYSSWEPVAYDTVYISKLVPLCKSRFQQTKNKFLKDRYGFQVTRALCVEDKYGDCIDFYDKVFNPGRDAGSMYFRSLGYKARALFRLKDFSRSNYIYSLLFDSDPCGRYPAFQSFHPQEEEDWKASLALAKTTREKEVLWQMLGIYADPLKAMQEIYALNPSSDLLSLLLVRAINIFEENHLVNPVNYNSFYYQDYSKVTPGSFEYDIPSRDTSGLAGFINRVIKEKKIGRIAEWQLASAFLLLVNDQLAPASAIISRMSINPKDSLVLGQAAILKGIIAAKEKQTLTAARESILYGHIQKILSFQQPDLRRENAVRYILDQLSIAYEAKGDTLKTELCYPQGITFYGSTTRLQRMIDFMSRKNLSPFEKFLIAKYPLTLASLYEEKAVAYMYEYRFADALSEFDKGQDAGKTELYGNPFTIHIVDCHDCDHMAEQKTKYTKYSFAKKMIELKAKADTSSNAQEKAQNAFLYANGLYNMTWYGNGRLIHETYLSDVADYHSYGEDTEETSSASSYTDCREALAWYQKAFSLSSNKEFRAKCVWMSAKCEHNLWLSGFIEDGKPAENADFRAGKYFNQLKNDFSDSKYYKEVISECGYFCSFITHSKNCIRHPE